MPAKVCARCGYEVAASHDRCWRCWPDPNVKPSPVGRQHSPGSGGITLVVVGAAIAIGLALLVSKAPPSPPPPVVSTATEGVLTLKVAACATEKGLDEVQTAIARTDWIGAAQVMIAYACVIGEPGQRWEMKERGRQNSLVYIYKGAVPQRGWVRTAFLN